MEYPDHPGSTRVGVGCHSKDLDGIVMYRDTRTGVAPSTVRESSSISTGASSSPGKPLKSPRFKFITEDPR